MDSNGKKPRGGNKAARPAPTTQQQPAARAAPETPALSDDSADAAAQQVDDGQPDVASVDESRGTKQEDNHGDDYDDDDEEQVERFYALLANIRAMRGLLPPHNNRVMASSSPSCGGSGDNNDTHAYTDTDTAGDSTTRTNKRLRRSAEPPWRPAFRMEDFEEPPVTTASTCEIRKRTTRGAGHDDHCGHGDSSGSSARPPVAVVATSSMPHPHAAVRFQQPDSSRSCSRD